MDVIDPGHKYLLGQLDTTPETPAQLLTFVQRVGPNYPGNVRAYPGTIMQEVLRALVERCRYLQGQIPCWQTATVRALCMACIWLLEWRAARRHSRRVPGFWEATYAPTCPQCGHVHGSTARGDDA